MITNPISIEIQEKADRTRSLTASLMPDAIGLRGRYHALVVHLHNVAEPIVWDLGKDISLIHTVIPLGVPMRICITCYGLLPDGSLRLLFRNWGQPGDGLEQPPPG